MRRGGGRSSLPATLALVLLAGCGGEDPPAAGAPTKPAPLSTAQDPEPDLPPLGEVTIPEGEIDRDDFAKIDPPEGIGTLAWDFTVGRQYAYAFSQTITQVTVNETSEDRVITRTRDRNRGVFEFTAQKDGRARALMRIEPLEKERDGKTVPKEEVRAGKPMLFDCTMRADGTAAEIRGKDKQVQEQAQTFFLVLLPIQLGEKAGASARFTTRIDGWRKVRRWECARLVTEFEMNPEAPTGKTLARGRTVAYFAAREGFFVQAETAVAQGTRVKLQDSEGRWMTSSYDSITVSRLKLKE